tara:strand:- start:102 stop:320 length:219 start_codon:yes stop_codon:yes gene_type:complete
MVDRRYEKTDESHALMLKALWHAVRPDEKYVGPVADEWEDVGFQKSGTVAVTFTAFIQMIPISSLQGKVSAK